MERARETGLRFNAEKCKIRCTEIPFFGHITSSNGLRPDPQKVETISSMDPSMSLADLQTFLGMTQFLSRYLPNLASHSAVLWDLTKRISEFQWQPQHQQMPHDIPQKPWHTLGCDLFFWNNSPYTPNSKMADSRYLALDALFPHCSPQIISSDHHFGIYLFRYLFRHFKIIMW